MAHNFRVGDRVMYTGSYTPQWHGMTGTVKDIRSSGRIDPELGATILVLPDKCNINCGITPGGNWRPYASNLTLIEGDDGN